VRGFTLKCDLNPLHANVLLWRCSGSQLDTSMWLNLMVDLL